MQRLEAQLRTLSETVNTLERQLAGYAQRNQELEADHLRLASYRAETERTVAERAADTIRVAEARASEVTAAAEARAQRLEQEARTRAMDLIEAIGAEIDALEQDARRFRGEERVEAADDDAAAEPKKPALALAGTPDAAADAASEAAAAEAAALQRVRGEIGDLLKLREAILLNIRGAVKGFEHELNELERPPLAVAGEGEAGDDPAADAVPEASLEAGGAPATGPLIEIEAAPVGGVLDASRIERELAAVGGDTHLRSVEGSTARLQIRGVAAQQLGAALASSFPGSKARWDGDDRVRLELAPPGPVEVTTDPGLAADAEAPEESA